MKLTKKLIETKLKNVIDPELGINIVDLGLIYDIKVIHQPSTRLAAKRAINHQPLVNILMTLTTPGCPLAAAFQPMVRQALADIPKFDPYKDLILELTFDPPWHQGLMSERARVELGFG